MGFTGCEGKVGISHQREVNQCSASQGASANLITALAVTVQSKIREMEKLRLRIEEQVVSWTHIITGAHRSFENSNFVRQSFQYRGGLWGTKRFLEEGTVSKGV